MDPLGIRLGGRLRGVGRQHDTIDVEASLDAGRARNAVSAGSELDEAGVAERHRERLAVEDVFGLADETQRHGFTVDAEEVVATTSVDEQRELDPLPDRDVADRRRRIDGLPVPAVEEGAIFDLGDDDRQLVDR